MASTAKKKKAKEKHSRQSNVMSNLENSEVMRGNFPRIENINPQSERDLAVDLDSDELLQNVI